MNNVASTEKKMLQVFYFGCGNTLQYVLWLTRATRCAANPSKLRDENMFILTFLTLTILSGNNTKTTQNLSDTHFKRHPSAGHKVAGVSVKAASQTD